MIEKILDAKTFGKKVENKNQNNVKASGGSTFSDFLSGSNSADGSSRNNQKRGVEQNRVSERKSGGGSGENNKGDDGGLAGRSKDSAKVVSTDSKHDTQKKEDEAVIIDIQEGPAQEYSNGDPELGDENLDAVEYNDQKKNDLIVEKNEESEGQGSAFRDIVKELHRKSEGEKNEQVPINSVEQSIQEAKLEKSSVTSFDEISVTNKRTQDDANSQFTAITDISYKKDNHGKMIGAISSETQKELKQKSSNPLDPQHGDVQENQQEDESEILKNNSAHAHEPDKSRSKAAMKMNEAIAFLRGSSLLLEVQEKYTDRKIGTNSSMPSAFSLDQSAQSDFSGHMAKLDGAMRSGIVNQVTAKLVQRGNTAGSQTIRIDMNPAELGRVEVKISIKDNKIKLSIRADVASTLEVLRADQRVLLNTLQDSGYEVDSGIEFSDFSTEENAFGNNFGRDGSSGYDGSFGSSDDSSNIGNLSEEIEIENHIDEDARRIDMRI